MEIPQDDPPEPSVPDSGLSDLPESDLAIPDDPILNFVNSQCHSSEDLDPEWFHMSDKQQRNNNQQQQ